MKSITCEARGLHYERLDEYNKMLTKRHVATTKETFVNIVEE